MIFYGTFKTTPMLKRPYEYASPRLDYIEFRTPDNRTISADWDESEWTYYPDTGEVSFRANGVYFDEEYAKGKVSELRDSVVDCVTVYNPCERPDFEEKFEWIGLEVTDGDDSTYTFDDKQMKECGFIFTYE